MRVPAAAAVLLLGALAAFEAAGRVVAEREVDLPLGAERRLRARLQVPASEGPLPAVMLFGGIERGAAALDLVSSARPTVMASFDYPMKLPEQASAAGVLAAVPAARRGIRDSLRGMGLLYAHLRTMPEVDPARISIVGVSLGAPFAVIAAADNGIPGLAVIHGFGDVPGVVAHQLIRRWEPEHGSWVRPFAHALAHLLNFATGAPSVERHASRLVSGQKVLVLIAADDERVPQSATDALVAGLRQSGAMIESELEEGGHLAGGEDPRIPALLNRTESWLIAQGL